MGEKKYRIFMAVVIVLTAAAVFFAIINNNYILSILAVVSALLASFMLKKQFSDIITEDERVRLLSMRSTRISYVLFNIAAVIAGNTLILLGKHGPANYSVIGYTLAFSVCVMLAIDVIAYFWLARVD